MGRETVFFCLTFDVEPDIGRIGGGMRGIEKGVPALLDRARPSGQVWRENNPKKEPVNQKLRLTLSPSSFEMNVYR